MIPPLYVPAIEHGLGGSMEPRFTGGAKGWLALTVLTVAITLLATAGASGVWALSPGSFEGGDGNLV